MTRNFDECLKFALYTAESGIKRIQQQQCDDKYIETYSILYDARSISWKNFDFEILKEFYKCTEMYPETLKRVFVLQPGFMFNMLFKVLKTIADARTTSKVTMIYDLKELHNHIDPDQIQVEFGGTSLYKYQ